MRSTSLCWRADGSLVARLERHKRYPRYGTFRAGAKPGGRPVDTDVIESVFAPPDGGALVYEELNELRVLDVATGNVRVLAGDSDGRSLRSPAWSPKGDRIAAVNLGGGIELLDPALGYGPIIPTSTVWTETLTWSPDGTTLGLQFKRPNESGARERYGLALVPAAADGRLRRLVQPVPYLSAPAWSPDGTALAVTRRGQGVRRTIPPC